MSESGRYSLEGGDDQPGCSPDRADPDPSQRIDVIADTSAADPVVVAWLRERLEEAAAAMAADVIHLNVVLIDDDRMKAMHAEFHDDPTTTDVLTFDLRDDPFEGAPEAGLLPAVEGEVYVCVDEARRRAEQLPRAMDKEMLLYALHGLLHLVGYDDHDEEQRSRMHAREDELLEQIGVGRVYGG